MTDARFKQLVAIDDKGWKLEAVQWDSSDSDMTRSYPGWFINLLVQQHECGFAISYSSRHEMWILRNPDGPDYQLTDGIWIVQNPYGQCFAEHEPEMERKFRLHDEEHDGKW